MRRLIVLLLLAASSSVAWAPAASQGETRLAAVEDAELVAFVTGPEAPSQTDVTYDVYGTDLGSMFDLDGTLYIAFGDTFGCCQDVEGSGPDGENWRNNVLGYTTDRQIEDGLTLDGMIVDDEGRARAVLEKNRLDITLIPTNGIAIDGRMYLHYMAVRRWGTPGRWTLGRSGWGYSDDGGQTWTQPPDSIWMGDTNFGQAALVLHDSYLYVFGIHGGRFGGVMLARVPADQVLDMAAYTYWNGSEWVSELESAVEVVTPPVGELSVAWNSHLERWIMTYLDEHQRAIVIREAPELTGPWSEPLLLVSGDDYPSLYGAYLHPWASDGETIYFNMSQWGPYNVLLMRARLVRAE
jgi:hypothetical protein